jgi:hypothetical protein
LKREANVDVGESEQQHESSGKSELQPNQTTFLKRFKVEKTTRGEVT